MVGVVDIPFSFLPVPLALLLCFVFWYRKLFAIHLDKLLRVCVRKFFRLQQTVFEWIILNLTDRTVEL